jgi:hypothetical protein
MSLAIVCRDGQDTLGGSRLEKLARLMLTKVDIGLWLREQAFEQPLKSGAATGTQRVWKASLVRKGS